MLAETSSTAYSVGYIFGVLVVALLFGFLGGKLTEGGGYPFWVGFLIGFFCGCIGLVINIVLYSTGKNRVRTPAYPAEMYYPPPDYYQHPQPTPPPDHAYQQGIVACPQCKSAVPQNEQFCWNCGSVTQWNQQSAQQLSAPAARTKICSLCHTRNAETAGYCAHCGSELGSAW